MKQKTFKIIEVPAYIDGEGLALCKSKKGEFCYYFESSFYCWESNDEFPNCSDKKIVYMEAESND